MRRLLASLSTLLFWVAVAGCDQTTIEMRAPIGARPVAGEVGEACHWDNSCAEGAVCLGVCVARSETSGALGGPCGPRGACEEGLECRDKICADPKALGAIFARQSLSYPPIRPSGPPGAPTPWSYTAQSLPASPAGYADLSPMMPPVGAQGDWSSCVAWTTTYAIKSYQEALERNRTPNSADTIASPAYTHFATEGVHNASTYQECMLAGSYLEESFSFLQRVGAVPMGEMEYFTLASFPCEREDEYTPALEERAEAWRIESFRYLFDVFDYLDQSILRLPSDDELRALKLELDAGRPVALVIRTPTGFYELGSRVLEKREVGQWKRGQHGYHAVALVGYDDGERTFKVMNSWGRAWGDAGYGMIRYDAFNEFVLKAGVSIDRIEDAPPFQDIEDCRPDQRYVRCESDISGAQSLVGRCGDREVSRERCEGGAICAAVPGGEARCATPAELEAACDGAIERHCVGQDAFGGSHVGLYCRVRREEESYLSPLGRSATCAEDQVCVPGVGVDGGADCVAREDAIASCPGDYEAGCAPLDSDSRSPSTLHTCQDVSIQEQSCGQGETCIVDGSGAAPRCVPIKEAEAECPKDALSARCSGELDDDGRNAKLARACGGFDFKVESCGPQQTCVQQSETEARCVPRASASCPAELTIACEAPAGILSTWTTTLSLCHGAPFERNTCPDAQACSFDEQGRPGCLEDTEIMARCDRAGARGVDCVSTDPTLREVRAVEVCGAVVVTSQACGAREACVVAGPAGQERASCVRDETLCESPMTVCVSGEEGERDEIHVSCGPGDSFIKQACLFHERCDDSSGQARCVSPPAPPLDCAEADVVAECVSYPPLGVLLESKCPGTLIPFKRERCTMQQECRPEGGVAACRPLRTTPPATTPSLMIRLRWTGNVHLDLAARAPNGEIYYYGAPGPRSSDPFRPKLDFSGGCENQECARTGQTWEETLTYPSKHPSGAYQIVVTNLSGGAPVSVELTAEHQGQTTPIPYQQKSTKNSESRVTYTVP